MGTRVSPWLRAHQLQPGGPGIEQRAGQLALDGGRTRVAGLDHAPGDLHFTRVAQVGSCK